MSIYVGINGVPKKASAMYVGVNGVPKKIKTVYCGNNGIHLVHNPYNYIVASTTMADIVIPSSASSAEVFCVGGGGSVANDPGDSWVYTCCGGGGGGYTLTKPIDKSYFGKTLSALVGSGAAISSTGYSYSGGMSLLQVIPEYTEIAGSAGGFSCCASFIGANGGSGGGAGGAGDYASSRMYWYPGDGGCDGGNGSPARFSTDNSITYDGGVGQGTTTRAFGESNGTLYAGGGGGGSSHPETYRYGYGGAGGGANGNCSANSNTGGGGGGKWRYGSDNLGGSGIVIIRWK